MTRAVGLLVLALGAFVTTTAQADEDPEVLPPLPAAEPVAPPPETAPTATAGPPMPPPAPKYPARFELRIGGGATYKRLLGLPMTMGNVDVALGARVGEMVAFNVAFEGDFGKTAHGLTTRVYTLAPAVELVADRFRLGFGPEVLWFGISRATTGATIAHGGVGARVITSLDVLSTEPVTFFVGGRGQLDWLFAGALFSVTGSAGLRF